MAVRWRKLCGDLKKEKYCNYINLKMKIVCDIIKIHCRYKKTNYSSNRCSMCVTVLIYHVYVPSGVGVLVCLSVWSSVHLSCLCPKWGGCISQGSCWRAIRAKKSPCGCSLRFVLVPKEK